MTVRLSQLIAAAQQALTQHGDGDVVVVESASGVYSEMSSSIRLMTPRDKQDASNYGTDLDAHKPSFEITIGS